MDCTGEVIREGGVPAIEVAFPVLDAVMSPTTRIIPFHTVPQTVCARYLTDVFDCTKVARGRG